MTKSDFSPPTILSRFNSNLRCPYAEVLPKISWIFGLQNFSFFFLTVIFKFRFNSNFHLFYGEVLPKFSWIFGLQFFSVLNF